MSDIHDTLALTLWIMSELLGEFFQTVAFVFPVLGVLFLLNLVFLLIFHIKTRYWHEIFVFAGIDGKIVGAKNKYRRFFWQSIHKLARQYFWIRSKFAR